LDRARENEIAIIDEDGLLDLISRRSPDTEPKLVVDLEPLTQIQAAHTDLVERSSEGDGGAGSTAEMTSKEVTAADEEDAVEEMEEEMEEEEGMGNEAAGGGGGGGGGGDDAGEGDEVDGGGESQIGMIHSRI
jgi:hypothetical protein